MKTVAGSDGAVLWGRHLARGVAVLKLINQRVTMPEAAGTLVAQEGVEALGSREESYWRWPRRKR